MYRMATTTTTTTTITTTTNHTVAGGTLQSLYLKLLYSSMLVFYSCVLNLYDCKYAVVANDGQFIIAEWRHWSLRVVFCTCSLML